MGHLHPKLRISNDAACRPCAAGRSDQSLHLKRYGCYFEAAKFRLLISYFVSITVMSPDIPQKDDSRSTEETRHLLRHLLASLAYRTQKALREAPRGFGSFQASSGIRTPAEILHHMGDLMYTTAFRLWGEQRDTKQPVGDLDQEIERFHASLEELSDLLDTVEPLHVETVERLLQGPLSDAITHVGQLAMLRRLAGSPLPDENYVQAAVDTDNVTSNQSLHR